MERSRGCNILGLEAHDYCPLLDYGLYLADAAVLRADEHLARQQRGRGFLLARGAASMPQLPRPALVLAHGGITGGR